MSLVLTMGTSMKYLTIILILLASFLLKAEDKLGILIIDPIPMNGVWKGNDTGANVNSQFSIRIDDKAPVIICKEKGGIFNNLSLDKKHLIDIKLKGKRLTSFRFSFKKYGKNKLRLWYKTMYGTWSISPVKNNINKKKK